MSKNPPIEDWIPLKQIDADKLFCNEDAGLEDESLFASYSLDRLDFGKLYSPDYKIATLFAYKGTGKSAALRLIKNRFKDSREIVVAEIQSADITPDSTSDSISEWTNLWKNAIVRRLASEVGARISVAYTDDATTLVQMAEQEGFKSANFVGYITKNLNDKYLLTKKPELEHSLYHKIRRYQEDSRIQIWALIDDIDANFRADSIDKAKVSGFFTAARLLAAQIKDLRIRATIRPNIWEQLCKQYDSLAQMREFQVPIEWSEFDIMSLLAKRVSSFYSRKGSNMAATLNESDSRDWIGLLFEDSMKWTGSTRAPHVVLDTLSRNRPRWLIELGKRALKRAQKNGHIRIKLEDITAELEEFGRARVTDMIAEYGSQCPQLEQLISCFREQEKTFHHDQLVSLIKNVVLSHTSVTLSGVAGRAEAKDIIRFLYYIGFLSARKDKPDGSFEHILYAENPGFLATAFDTKNPFTWEVHPVFVAALQMKSRRPVSGIGARKETEFRKQNQK